ncbi:MAG: hypothetical protein N2513_07755 [Deltaproteobacteria bacterium]|nr:hypothetical protein [Deltaproteobacteria bacterium]
MKIRVNISTNFVSLGNNSVPTEIDLDAENNTLLELLCRLNERLPHLKLTNNGEMGEDLKYVYLNGISHFNLPYGLKTRLNQNDLVHVEIFMEPLAGG